MKTKDYILKQINENPGSTLMELSKNIYRTKSNISIHVKRLERDNLIIKHLTEDNNKFRLHPTQKGKEMYLKTKLGEILKISRKRN